ncbi:DDE-type integrase/transposase/recombinase [Pseudomonas sp. G(2018)]|uniref:DDE-type integrase/transposase/recombinase n=1 Tax=Pseudomonas sp. G(2018) TaxID=2502242 RepID=UPI0010F51692|nr:DDE-type integrase/transposase/recombinase [Pseudomonas sp. G(2018)]
MNIAIENFTLKVGEQWKFHTEIYLVIAVDSDRAQLRSTVRRNHIAIHTLERLRQAFRHGNLSKVQEAPLDQKAGRIIEAMTDEQRAVFERSLFYTRRAETEYGGSLPRKQTVALIKRLGAQISDPSPPCYTTVYEWVKAYRHAGGNPIALVKGTRSKQRRLDIQPHVVRDAIDYWVRELYLTDLPSSITEVTDAITCSLEDINSKRPTIDQLHVPSSITIYRIIKEYDKYEKDLLQKGQRHALKKQKWSRKTEQPERLLERIECDTQVMDLFVVDENGKVIGRPYLTVLLEVRSRYIIGYDISLNPPCIEKTLRALKRSLRSDRDHTGLGQTYIMDNGSEFAVSKLGYIMHLLGSEIVYCEPYAPDQKPHVERWFKTQNIQFVHHLSGTTFSNPEERGDYPSEKKAVYKIEELNTQFEKFLAIYHHAFHRSLNDSPHNTWEKNLDPFSPPKRMEKSDIKRLLWSKTTALPTNGMITFDKLRWSGPAISALSTRGGKKVRLTVFYDISDLGTVSVCHPNWPDDLLPVEAYDENYQRNLTLEMHHLVQQKLRKEGKKFDFIQARKARINYILELRKAKGKTAHKRIARLNENGSLHSTDQPYPAKKTAVPPLLPEVTLTEAIPPTFVSTVKVRHE